MNAAVLAGIAALALACEDAGRPLDPVWGKQACAHCAMLLSGPRFGAQLTTEAGDRYYFDDPGCMASFVRERPVRVRAMWVHDQSGWVDAKSARYEAAVSPMDYGFAPSSRGTADWAAVDQAAAQRGEKR